MRLKSKNSVMIVQNTFLIENIFFLPTKYNILKETSPTTQKSVFKQMKIISHCI